MAYDFIEQETAAHYRVLDRQDRRASEVERVTGEVSDQIHFGFQANTFRHYSDDPRAVQYVPAARWDGPSRSFIETERDAGELVLEYLCEGNEQVVAAFWSLLTRAEAAAFRQAVIDAHTQQHAKNVADARTTR